MKIKINMNRLIVMTIILIIFITFSSFLSVYHINKISEENCFDILAQSARNMSREIETRINNDSDQLEVIASIISQHDLTSDHVSMILSIYKSRSTIDRLEILLPDNTVILSDGSTVNADGTLSFEKEAALGEHISDKETDITDPQNPVLRNYVPIKRDGQTVAMLCGVTDLKTLPQQLDVSVYGGEADIYIIDGKTGEYLVDTRHHFIGNMNSVGARTMKKGYSNEKLTNDVFEGNTDHVVFVSNTSGEYLYFFYQPTSINEWRIGISVSENVAFKSARKIRNVLLTFAALEIICFIIYFILMLKKVRKDTYEKQKRLDMLSYLYGIKKTLFTAHLHSENIDLALTNIASITSAETAFFMMLDKNMDFSMHLWNSADASFTLSGKERDELLYKCFKNTDTKLELHSIESIHLSSPELYGLFKSAGIHNCMAVPVKDIDNNLIGVLGVLNITGGNYMSELLENVTLSFSMLHHNIQSFNTIKEMGEMDFLTGLLNRNSFQKDLSVYARADRLACVYADANGLHELNNTKGHEAGDNMLRCIARIIQDQFGQNHTYRIGGDEFAAFETEYDEQSAAEKIEYIKKEISSNGYHASVGMKWIDLSDCADRKTAVDELIKAAEQEMYAEKRRYYESKGHDRRSRS